MSPSRPDTDQAAAAKARLDEAATQRDEAIDAARRTFWRSVAAEISAKHLTQTAAASHLNFSREHIRKQIKRYTHE